MRVGVILPAETVALGGVQRFGDELHRAMRSLADVESFRVHPDLGAPRTMSSRARAFAGGWRNLIEGHRTHPFDAVFTTFHWPCRLLPGVPMVGFVHDLRSFDLVGEGGFARRGRSPEALFYRALWRTWDRVLVPSTHVARDVERLDPAFRVAVVGEGLDHLDTLCPDPEPVRDLVLVLGGRAPHKRGDLGAEVAARLASVLGGEALILGEVSAKPRGGVRVMREYSDQDLCNWLVRARVFVAPSEYEGFGLGVGEAMRFGVPIVYAADCPMQELVGDGGVPAPPEPVAMTEAALDVWKHSQALGVLARTRADRLTWSATAQRVLEELGEAARERGR